MSVSVNAYESFALYNAAGQANPGRKLVMQVQTNANGQWSAAFPAGFFTAAPAVFAVPYSTDNTAPNGAYCSVVAPTLSGGAWSANGLVLLPAAIQALGGLPAKAAGQGVVVTVTAVGP